MQYCYKCGAEINQINATHTCVGCGAHIYGQKYGRGAGFVAGSFLDGGLIGVIGSAVQNTVEKTGTKTDKEILNEYLNSDFYKFNQLPIEKVFTDKGLIGEYLVEGWLKGYQREPGCGPLCCPFSILYNLMIPEPDGSFQEIDMVVITQYCLFAIEIKNRNYNLHIEHWSDSNCVINGENAYSPIMQNEKHITALRYLLLHSEEVKRNLQYSPAILPINTVCLSPYASFDVSYEFDDWDLFSMESSDFFVLNGYNLTSSMNNKLQRLMAIEYCEYIDIGEIYNYLYPYCEISSTEKSMSMRYRDEYNQNSKKHPWKYYLVQYDTGLCKIARENGVYKQIYLKDAYSKWTFFDGLTNVKEIFTLDSLKSLMSVKQSLDENEYLNIQPSNERKKMSEDSFNGENLNSKEENMNTIMYCPQCGKKINGGNFCKYCGSKL